MTPDPGVSPCTGVCRLDVSRLCQGCGRSAEEIAGWGTAAPAVRAEVWARLPARRAALGQTQHRLPWGPDQLREGIRASLAQRSGAWVLGVAGGLAEFSVGKGEPLDLDVAGPVVSAVTPRGALRLRLPADLRALAVDPVTGPPPGPGPGPGPVVLAVGDGPSDRSGRAAQTWHRPPAVVTRLGPDSGAVRPTDRATPWFDLGLGSRVARFCVRTDHPRLLAALEATEGRPWAELMVAHGRLVFEVAPDRVVETRIGRIEVAAPIPPPGGRSPDGPHTHLLADQLVAGRETFDGLELAPGWVVGATWYPVPPEDTT